MGEWVPNTFFRRKTMIRFFQRGASGNKKARRRQLRSAMGLPLKPGRHERTGGGSSLNVTFSGFVRGSSGSPPALLV
jgi:hypothetical protein